MAIRDRCLHILMFLFLLGNDVADFVSDWLFFNDVSIAEKGLVYGPPEPAVKWCLLLFSIIGTVTFGFECINLWWEYFRNNPWLDSDWLSAVVIWIEDVPQIAISLHLALCREEAISVFQMTKAILILVSVVVRIIMCSFKYCKKDAVLSHHHVKVKVAIILGIILESICAFVIFFLIQTERNHEGAVSFRVPSTVVEDEYNDQKYFANVSLFIHHGDLFDANQRDPNMQDNVLHWARLATINSIRSRGQDGISFKIDYTNNNSGVLNLAFSEKQNTKSNWTFMECYAVDRNTDNITDVASCFQSAFLTNITSVFIKLQYEGPGAPFKKKVFGDIRANIKILSNRTCASVSEYADSVFSRDSHNNPIVMHYYRTKETLHPTNITHLLRDDGSMRLFRNVDSELIDVSTVWKTGWRECDSNGRTAPVLDTDLQLFCS